jgi:ketosteroid isomerase-like protein
MRRVPAVLAVTLFVTAVAAQTGGPVSAAFEEMANAERAFVQVAQAKNWRLAFLEYFVEGIRGFDGEDIKEGLRRQPDPPSGLEFWWEPRYGDIAASGELGWLTGPVRRRLASVNDGKPTFGNYASIWKRQPDGAFKVILDVGINLPDAAPFPPGATRVPMESRYTGPQKGDAGEEGLLAADRQLSSAIVAGGQAAAYSKSMAPFARFHRTGYMPLTEKTESLAWLEKQPAWTAGETAFAEVAQSGDLGYTWGSYLLAKDGSEKPESGHYVRVWSRDADGRWLMVLDVLQPKRPPA